MSSIIKENTMSWDDGKHEKVKRVQLTHDDNLIHSIEVTYEGTILKPQRRGSVGLKSDEFTLDSDEHITSISAYFKRMSSLDGITALTFKTNKEKKTLGPYGNETRFKFSALEVPGRHIAGFLGKSNNVLNSIDVHYAHIGEKKLEAQGASLLWDDGTDHDGVTKIYIRHHGDHGIQFVKFDYMDGGETKEGVIRGTEGNQSGVTDEIMINHPEEYLVSVEAWHNSTTIMGIRLKTNQKNWTPYFGKEPHEDGTKFTLEAYPGMKIIGFHGTASNCLHSIGAYVIPIPIEIPDILKVEAKGCETGAVWDDGGDHENVKKIYIGQGQGGIVNIRFEYTNGSNNKYVPHENLKVTWEHEFELESDEYITSMDGTYQGTHATGSVVAITSVIFYTNKRKSDRYGMESGTPLAFKEKAGYKISGFHGRAGDFINAIGFYLKKL